MKKAWSWKNVDLTGVVPEKVHQDFEGDFYRKALEYEPENVDILVFLGDAFAKRGQIEDGLEIDKRLVRVCPTEPTYFYNLACSHSLLNQIDPALTALEKAISLGYQNFDHLQTDSDLDNIRSDRRFVQIMKTCPKGV
jgi:tetratricopeptide (TPR) repeat protein